jgi:hypothetical protein
VVGLVARRRYRLERDVADRNGVVFVLADPAIDGRGRE